MKILTTISYVAFTGENLRTNRKKLEGNLSGAHAGVHPIVCDHKFLKFRC